MTIDVALTSLSIADALRQLADGAVSSVALTEAYLERIAALDPSLRAFITITADDALRDAYLADERRAAGTGGALGGIPVALKDLFDTRGVRTTAGSKLFAERVPDRDAAVVERLRAAGAVSLGKLNMHEWALGVTNVNPHFGAARNPSALDRVTGGSSGGSAAAVAAGLCAGSLGSDTGGSIRIPAALCGVVGLKPTRGRVSGRGAVPLSWNLDHIGPLARTVEDVALLLQVIAGYDAADPHAVNVPMDDYDYTATLDAGIAGWRVGVLSDAALDGVDAQVRDAFHAAAAAFTSLGATTVSLDLPELAEAQRLNGLITTADAAAFHHERLERSANEFGADVLSRMQRGASYPAREYIAARQAQAELRRRFTSLFAPHGGELDLILTPTTPCAAPRIDGIDSVALAPVLTRFTAPFNLTGLPALSIPCGTTHDDLPIGLQIIGPEWQEARVLQAGRSYERAREEGNGGMATAETGGDGEERRMGLRRETGDGRRETRTAGGERRGAAPAPPRTDD